MKSNLSVLIMICRIIKKETATFLRKNWFNIILIGVTVHFFSQNDVQVKLSMSTSTIFEQQRDIASWELKDSKNRKIRPATTLGIGHFSFDSKNKKNVETRSKSQSNEDFSKINKEFEKPSFPSFLSFIFYDDPTGEYSIDPSLLNEQRTICVQFINRFAPVAVSEMNKFGIPASIKLAQALLESNAGKSNLLSNTNNYFGIKCFSKNCKKGHCTNSGHKDFYRTYGNAWESFRGHSIFLQNKAYQNLQNLNTDNYKEWALGLEAAGYSVDNDYAEKLIRIIEVLELYKFDT